MEDKTSTVVQSLIDLTADYYWEQDTDQRFTRVVFASHLASRRDSSRYIGRTLQELDSMLPSDPEGWDAYTALFNSRQPIRDFIVWQRSGPHDVSYYSISGDSISGDPVFDAQQHFRGYCGVVRNVTCEKNNEDHASTFELAAVGIAHVEADGRFLHVNQKLCDMLGYTREELLERTVWEVSHPQDERITNEDRRKLRTGEISSFKTEKRYLRKNGDVVWIALTSAVKRDPKGHALYDISVVEDISARKSAEERVQYLATHDDMTGLPNRALFNQLLRHTIDNATRFGRQFAVLFIDLDRFKQINDTLGHDAGDILLKEMALRFRTALRAGDVVARLGGDEFVVLVQEIDNKEQVTAVARNLLSAAMKPVEIMGQECRVTASIGVSFFPADGHDEQTMMKNADIAMYLAKEEGKNNVQFYSRDIKSHSIEKMTLETHLRHALELNEFSVHYQAKVNIKTGVISGVEALLRWDSQQLGPVSPMRFIPLAEETGLIITLGQWVLRQACKQNLLWQQHGLPPVRMSINLSARQFADPELVIMIKEVLTDIPIEPSLLELEITESMVMHNIDKALRQLQALKALGVRIAIDDFGTGYSSLSQLRMFPVDTLKVDRSFIRELQTNAEDRAITQALIAMGRTLGVTVVAEGVETAEQQNFLSENACDEMQGYYFSKPIDSDGFESLLRNHKPDAVTFTAPLAEPAQVAAYRRTADTDKAG